MRVFERIVALFETGWAASPLRNQLALAAMLLLFMLSWPLWIALSEPSLGLRFVRLSSTAMTIVPSHSQAELPKGLASAGEIRQASIWDAGAELIVTPQELLETAGVEAFYQRQQAYYAQHRAYWDALQRPMVTVQVQGQRFEIAPKSKSLSELGPRFWWPWTISSFSLAVVLAVWLFSPNRRIATLYLLSALAFTFIMGVVASSSSRLLSQPHIWETLLKLTHVAAHLQNICLGLILWQFPQPLSSQKTTQRLTFALLGWASIWLMVDLFEWVDTIAIGFRLPIAVMGIAYVVLLALQWRRAHDHPLHRSQLRWLMLLYGLSFSAVFVAYTYSIQTDVQIDLPQAYGFNWIAIMYLGLIPLATRLKMFALEAWWARAWAWLLGGLLVVALDVALLQIFRLSSNQALLMSMALAGWVYFPLRQWLWEHLLGNQRKRVQDFLPQVVQLVTISQQPGAEHSLRQHWQALWEAVFAPRQMSLDIGASKHLSVRILELGQSLSLPAVGHLPALKLELALRGARLFNPGDVKLSEELLTLVRQALEGQLAFARGAAQERRRIAADLHDDLGARLLSIAQAANTPTGTQNTAEMARQALDDMRLSVRGLSAEPAPAFQVVADWRSEVLQRLQSASIEVDWQADEPPSALLLDARMQVQLTRILREAVSNLIHHAQASHCLVELHFTPQSLTLRIHDNGKGLSQTTVQLSSGHGLLNIERRAHRLGGQHRFSSSSLGGALIEVQIPLEGHESNFEAPAGR
jgi:signal transduction histidine kinase